MATNKINPPLSELDSLRQQLTPGERAVLDFFANNLNSGWEIYIQPHLNGLRPDFVLLNPMSGVAVVEVKDWDLDALNYYYETDERGAPRLCATRDGKTFSRAKDDPVVKIQIYKNMLADLFSPNIGKDAKFSLITGCIIFPFADSARVAELFSQPRAFYEHDKYHRWNTISGSSELISQQGIKKILPSVHTHRNQEMLQRYADDLRHWLIEPEYSREQREPLVTQFNKRQFDAINTSLKKGLEKYEGQQALEKHLFLQPVLQNSLLKTNGCYLFRTTSP